MQLIKSELNVKEVDIVLGEGEMRVEFDTNITPELKEEGEVRDLIRQIQEARKESGCDVSEKVKVGLPCFPPRFEDEIKRKTLAIEIFKSEKIEIKR